MLKQNDFYSFNHHAYVEHCKFLISVAASLIYEIQYYNPQLKL
jgi:hypothetical protein